MPSAAQWLERGRWSLLDGSLQDILRLHSAGHDGSPWLLREATATWISANRDDPQPAAASGTVTYQFYENVFAHPYVTSGVLLAWLSGTQKTYATSPVYQLLSTEKFSTIQARPVIGGGFKSYFDNGRAFMRSELLMAIDPHGPPHALLRIGAGVDF